MPSLVLFSGLPCACSTEDCFDTTALCTLNRLNVPLLQTIMFGLSLKILRLHANLTRVARGGGIKSVKVDSRVGELTCVLVASVLCLVSFGVEDRTYGSAQYNLQMSRSAFLCKMRLPSFNAEFVLMHLPVVASGGIITFYMTRVIAMVVKSVNQVQSAAPSSSSSSSSLPSSLSSFSAQPETASQVQP